MKKIIFSLSLSLLAFMSSAQNDVDALRYSTTKIIWTARFMAMGGACGSRGADFSTLSSNPAGLGLDMK